ncbi:unnamed protein product [Callosobruchus maculatus]|uniref:Reverse transcriptase domain-containing protein n=1 Tax=Callosobruchus maculatus TaxID=64391 RepID=A0A653CA83_CALMS|nr:unnamed protein product [Callosobruchus maculatus]
MVADPQPIRFPNKTWDDRIREFLPTLVIWVRSALGSRTVRAIQGDFQRDILVRGGCQQGSCLSPLLWCLVMDSLLESLAQQDFQAQAYANDGVVVVSGRFLSTVCDRMQMACRIIEGWCTETGLSVNPTKTELVLFCGRRKLEGFRTLTMYGRPLAISQEVKYLGMIFDWKLTWGSHVDRLVSRWTATFWQLRRAVGRTCGLNPNILQWIYTAIIRPRMQYGSVVWWSCVQKSTVARSLGRIQRVACVGVTGAMRTSPTAALEVLLGLPTMASWIRMTAVAAHLRMRDSGNWQIKGEAVGHAKIARLAEEALPISPTRLSRQTVYQGWINLSLLPFPISRTGKEGRFSFPKRHWCATWMALV